MSIQIRRIDYVVLNAGILNYPNVSDALELSDQVLTVLESHRSVMKLALRLIAIAETK